MNGQACIIPFTVNGVDYNTCVKDQRLGNRCWCPISVGPELEPLEVEVCSGACTAVPALAVAPANNDMDCETNSGKFCQFPFIYNGNTYTQCTTVDNGVQAWCATEVNNDMTYRDYDNCNVPTCMKASLCKCNFYNTY